MKKAYYIEMYHDKSDSYDFQSRWFKSKRAAENWYTRNVDYISKNMYVYVMVATFTDNDNYDIDECERIQ